MENNKILRQVIGKVSWKDEREHKRHLVAIAENIEWELISSRNLNIGDFILCDVICDSNIKNEDCHHNLYLQDKNLPLSNKEEWQKQKDEELEKIWDDFADICIDEDECIDTDFHFWKKGTFREDIWHYFDENHSKGVHYLIYERA